jgi:hypothetical protein
MANEPNTPDHRWYERRNNIALSNDDFSRETIFDSGIQKINSWINSQPWGVYYSQLVLDFDDEYYRVDGGDTTFASAITHTRASTATYVDSTGTLQTAAINQPRLGHHVWNGTAWVNEGLLHESEARTNLVPVSVPSTSGWGTPSTVLTTNEIASPTGAVDGSKVVANTSNAEHYIEETFSVTSGSVYTFSVFLKKLGYSNVAFRIPAVGFANSAYLDVNMDAGTVAYGGGTIDAFGIENAGNGWFRVYMTRTANSNNTALFRVQPNLTSAYVGDNLSGVYVWGAQAEIAPTVSSHIPTAGSTVTRSADVLTIPAANLPYPEPVVIGPELVTNGTFDSGTTGWASNVAGVNLSVSSGQLTVTNSTGGTSNSRGGTSAGFPTQIGKVYLVTGDCIAKSGYTGLVRFASGNGPTYNTIRDQAVDVGQSASFAFVATQTTSYAFVSEAVPIPDGASYTVDNISVREINPLALSIQMDGRVTYADTDNAQEARIVRWVQDGSNLIQHNLRTLGSLQGSIRFEQGAAGVFDNATSADVYAPDILVPFNIAGRHGSTFVNGAVDGVALTADTTPVALPDLSSTDLNIGFVYNGTIRTFRMWGQDIGDTGLVEATEPSLVPSLSLTFDGTENSFIVEDWSE